MDEVLTERLGDIADVALAATQGEHAMPLAVQLGAAIVLLIAANMCDGCHDSPSGPDSDKVPNWGFTVTAAAIAMCTSILGLVLLRMREIYDRTLFTLPTGEVTVGYFLACFNLAWWTIAAGIITFENPFTSTGNGYFATWTGFVFSVLGLGVSATKMIGAASRSGPLLLLGAASTVVVFASPRSMDHDIHKGNANYAMLVAVLTVIAVISFLFMAHTGRQDVYAKLRFPVLLALSALWLIEACLVTFRGPFTLTGNGYFGSWAATILCVQAAFAKGSLFMTADPAEASSAVDLTSAREAPLLESGAPLSGAALPTTFTEADVQNFNASLDNASALPQLPALNKPSASPARAVEPSLQASLASSDVTVDIHGEREGR